MKRSAKAAQSDPKLVGGFGIVALKDGAAVDQDLLDGRVQLGGKRLPGAVLVGDARWASRLGFGAVVFLAQRKVAAFGLAARAWLEFMPGEQLFGSEQQTLGTAGL